MQSRLKSKAYDGVECRLALRGQAVPGNLGNDVARLCTLSGIRHHISLAITAEVGEMADMAGQEIIARARNARLIMSNRIPSQQQMPGRMFFPYCIWYPDIATEATYRELAAQYPEMRYQVGRACAVGGYDQLYHELDLLPDPLIAEEARENMTNPAARHIYESIMAAPVRYAVMNDYSRTVEIDRPKAGAFLNADTAVRASLERRQKCHKRFVPLWPYFNITEDWGIAEKERSLEPPRLTDDETALFYSPLPVDLPSMQKDLLILMAAHDGNVDRYARLRRPRRLGGEFACVIRGIYHSTAMALWFKHNAAAAAPLALRGSEVKIFRRAINARLAMNGAVGHIIEGDEVPDDELPYWLWYPTTPLTCTLIRLAQARPAMRPQCARACIALGQRAAYHEVMNMPDPEDGSSFLKVDFFMKFEAQASSDRAYFEADLQKRQEAQGIADLPRVEDEDWKENIAWRSGSVSSDTLLGQLLNTGLHQVTHGLNSGQIYEDLSVDAGPVLLHLSSTAAERSRARDREFGYLFLAELLISPVRSE